MVEAVIIGADAATGVALHLNTAPTADGSRSEVGGMRFERHLW